MSGKKFSILKCIASLFCLLTIVASPHQIVAQGVASQNNVMASFIYNFAGFLTWPETSTFQQTNNEFVIFIVGNDQLVDPLQYISSRKTVQGKAIRVKHFDAIPYGEPCHMLILGNGKEHLIADALGDSLLSKAVLITECADCLDKGTAINFVTEEDRIRFEINKKALDKRHIYVSSRLLNLAIKVI